MKPTKRFVQNDDAITYNQRMSLNGMAQLNVNENGLSEKDSFDSNVYHVYVAGEGGRQKTPHFHIRHKSEGWDIRMNMDGSFHSIKKNTSERQNQINFNVINTRNRKDANYLIRYFYTDVRDENNYTLDKYSNKDDTAKNNQDSDIVSVWFDFKNINVTRDSKPLNNTNYTITFYINAFLFPKDNTEVELVNTSAIIHNRKYLYRAEAQSMYNYDKSFTINFTNISREHNYKYDLQLKVNVFIRDRIQNEEF